MLKDEEVVPVVVKECISLFLDMMNYTVNIHNEGAILEIVTNAGKSFLHNF